MKLIGRGWQYEVYDLGNGRVLKKRYSGFSQYRKIFLEIARGKPAFIKAYMEQKRVQCAERDSSKYIQSILNHIDSGFLGNLYFKDDGDYEQDKVTPLREILEKRVETKNKKLLDHYVTLIKELWGYGFADTVYNFSINNGVYNDGRMIQLDFGEITTDKEKVQEMIQKKRWLQSSSYKRLYSEELKQYYAGLMKDNLTESELKVLWGSKLEKNPHPRSLKKLFMNMKLGLSFQKKSQKNSICFVLLDLLAQEKRQL